MGGFVAFGHGSSLEGGLVAREPLTVPRPNRYNQSTSEYASARPSPGSVCWLVLYGGTLLRSLIHVSGLPSSTPSGGPVGFARR